MQLCYSQAKSLIICFEEWLMEDISYYPCSTFHQLLTIWIKKGDRRKLFRKLL